jgi:hypothetical protein
MKTSLSILFVISSLFSAFANRIDDLKTAKDVEAFVTSIDTNIQKSISQGQPFYVIPDSTLACDENYGALVTKSGIRSWEKIDLNGDGRTDLLVHGGCFGTAVFVAIDMGGDLYKLYRLFKRFDTDLEVARAVQVNGQTVLILYGQSCKGESIVKSRDTLIYRDEGFVEYQAHPAHYHIAYITFTAGGCPMGTCQAYRIRINEEGSARYVASSYIPNEGVYTGNLNAADLGRIKGLVNYTRFRAIREPFEDCSVMDAGIWTIEVGFADGSKKRYDVRGDQAPFGLLAIEDFFSEIRQTQRWEKIK